MTEPSPKCATSSKCRQPIAFVADADAWQTVVCEKHLGLLCARLTARANNVLVRRVRPSDL